MMNRMIGMRCAIGLAGVAYGANPIRKVVNLLQDMKKQIEEEAQQEEDLYKKFACYVKTNTASMNDEARAAQLKIEKLRAEAKAEAALKKQLEADLTDLKKNRAAAIQSLKVGTSARAKENATYLGLAGETKGYIDSMDSAITALERGSGRAFMQTETAQQLRKAVEAASDPDDKEQLLAFLSGGNGKDFVPQSGEIVGVLKNMRDEMDKDLGGITGEEEKAVACFEELKSAKTAEIQAGSQAIEKKLRRVGELGVSIVEKKADAENTANALGEKQAFLATLAATATEKAAQWEARQKERHEEVGAIHEAIQVLNDDDSLDVFKNSSAGKKKPSFLQRRGDQRAEARALVMRIVQSSQSKNPALSLLAHTVMQKLKEGEMSFAKYDFKEVFSMIDKMLAVLAEEQKVDNETRDTCVEEFHQAELRMKDAVAKLTTHESEVAEFADNIEQLKKDIEDGQKQIQEIDIAIATGTQQRKSEHKEYIEQENLNEAAVQLIEKAKNKLNKYYNPQLYVGPKKRELTREEEIYRQAGGEVDDSVAEADIAGTSQTTSLSFVQIRKEEPEAEEKEEEKEGPGPIPEVFKGEYKNKGQKGSSVLALMDMLKKDLEIQIVESKKTEEANEASYAKMLMQTEKQKKATEKAITASQEEKADQEEKLDEAKQGVIIGEADKSNEEKYQADLHAKCDFIQANYDIREDSRRREADSLKQAKAVLKGADFK